MNTRYDRYTSYGIHAVCISLAFVFFSHTSFAQSTTSAQSVVSDSYPIEKLQNEDVLNDFVVGPGRFALEIAPGESQTVEIVVSNRMGERKRFSLGVEDMTGSQNPEEAVVLLGDARGPYTIQDYIQFPQKEFELDHAERARIPVTVTLPADAEPGGRYGTLLVSIVSRSTDTDASSGAQTGSVVVSRIGTLFFVTTPGSLTEDLELSSFTIRDDKVFFTEGPIEFDIVHENKASVHATPYGEVRIYNMQGREVGFVELEPWFVMPKSLRLREVSWNRELLLGRYTAELKVNRGYNDIVDETSVTFWVVPIGLIAVVFCSLFAFFFILYFILSRFEFRRKGG